MPSVKGGHESSSLTVFRFRAAVRVLRDSNVEGNIIHTNIQDQGNAAI